MSGIVGTGNEIVDALKVLQVSQDMLVNDTDEKIARIRDSIRQGEAGIILNRHFMVSSGMVLGYNPESNNRRKTFFGQGLFFTGRLEHFNYLFDEDIPLDSLALNFVSPEVFEADSDHAPKFRELTLQVPVMAIDSCLLLDIGDAA